MITTLNILNIYLGKIFIVYVNFTSKGKKSDLFLVIELSNENVICFFFNLWKLNHFKESLAANWLEKLLLNSTTLIPFHYTNPNNSKFSVFNIQEVLPSPDIALQWGSEGVRSLVKWENGNYKRKVKKNVKRARPQASLFV